MEGGAVGRPGARRGLGGWCSGLRLLGRFGIFSLLVLGAPLVNPEEIATTSRSEITTLSSQILVEFNQRAREQFETYQREVKT